MISLALTLLAAGLASAERPNVIVFLADDLGYGELGSYGQAKIETPNIDRLASEGMRFTRFYSGSAVCAPARCVLLTGLHTGHAVVRANWENGGWGPDEPEGQFPLPEGTWTLARALKGHGYRTAAIGKWGLGGPGTSGHPNRQGFDLFFGYLCQRKAHNYYPTHLWRNDEKVVLEGNDYFRAHQKLEQPLDDADEYWERYAGRQYAPELMLEEALAFVGEASDEPFFLYYASPIPHVALQVPPEGLERYPVEWDDAPYLGSQGYTPHPSPRRGYAALVSHLDDEVGRILDLLDEHELADDTIVLFTSDNGPTYAGGVDHEFFASAGGLRGLKGSLYEGGIRVPLLARWPERIASGRTTDVVGGFQDLLPTILALAGDDRPVPGGSGAPVDGVSLAPTLLGRGEQAAREYLYWEYNGQQALLLDGWKAVRPRLRKGDLTLELYRLEEDPSEEVDVAGEHRDVVALVERVLTEARTPTESFPLATIDDR